MAHARLSPSKAYQWMVCAAAPSRSEGRHNPQNVYAIEGTFAHALAAHCLNTSSHPAEFAGKRGREFLSAEEMDGYLNEDYAGEQWAFEYFDQLTVDDDMVGYIAGYCDLVSRLAAMPNAILLVEQRVDLSPLLGAPGEGGTADAIVILPERREVHTIDLKYGKGKTVFAQDNKQLLLYTFGVHDNVVEPFGVEVDRYVSTIYQPRKNHVDTAEYTYDQLFEFAKQASIAAFNTRAPNPHAKPGEDVCSYCLAAGDCRERAALVFETVSGEPLDDDDFKKMVDDGESPCLPVELLGPDDFAKLLPKLDFIRDWCDAVLVAAMREAEAGHPPPGYKVVGGKLGARKWTDEAAVEDIIRNSMRVPTQLAYKMSLISPTQAEKNLKPKQYSRLKEFITQSFGKPALVPESDKRPAIQLGVTDSEFANPQTD